MLTRLIRNLFGTPADAAGELLEKLEQARALLKDNRPQEALDAIAPFLARNPDHAEALFVRGTALVELSRADEALPSLTRATKLSPREPRYLFNLALAHWMLGNSARTIELCKKAVEYGDFHQAHTLLANIELHGEHYFAVLSRLHQYLRPATYVEVGVFRGWSLQVVHPDTLALGVDPQPVLEQPAGPNQRVFAETSDHFFATHDVLAEFGGRRVEMAFIDGMHYFEFALRDFINIERLATRETVVLVHDCYPLDAPTASRDRSTVFWSGDVWRLILLLKKYRPALVVKTIATPPTGLGVILNLDPQSRVLSDNLDAIIAEFMATDFTTIEGRKQEAMNLFPNDWPAIQGLLDSRASH